MIGKKFQCLCTVQQLMLVVEGRLLTSAFGVFSVWIKIVRIAPATACGWNMGFSLPKAIRGLTLVLEIVKGIKVVC